MWKNGYKLTSFMAPNPIRSLQFCLDHHLDVLHPGMSTPDFNMVDKVKTGSQQLQTFTKRMQARKTLLNYVVPKYVLG